MYRPRCANWSQHMRNSRLHRCMPMIQCDYVHFILLCVYASSRTNSHCNGDAVGSIQQWPKSGLKTNLRGSKLKDFLREHASRTSASTLICTQRRTILLPGYATVGRVHKVHHRANPFSKMFISGELIHLLY